MAKLKDGFYKLTAEAVGSNSYMLLAGGGSKALSDFATASGVVTALGTNGNYVTWTKNGTVNNLTVPYATTASSASKWATARTLTIGNKGQSVNGTANVTWDLHDILLSSTQIGVSTSWLIYTPGVYYVASSSAFTGDGNPERANGGLTPYRYGQLIVSRATTGGVAQFYISHIDSSDAIRGIKYRTGWNSTYQATWASILDSSNYTLYVNTTNFPGLNKTGTVTSITLTAGSGISITNSGTAITTSGTRTITNSGVRSTTINGNYLRVNTNGTNADLTIPYATSAGSATNADTLDNIHANGLLTALSSNTTNAVSITVGGTTKNITATTLKTSLGLGSNAYTSTAYLPLTGGTLSGDLYFNHTNTETRGYIGWIQGSYHERLQINDGDTDGASTFTFLISRDKGSTWKDLLQIKNNSTIVATTFLGKLAYTNLTGSGTTANLAIVSTGTANGWTLKTLGSRAFDSTAYLPLAGGTMTNDATIKFNATGGIIQTTATTSNATNLITWYKGTTKDDNYSHPAQIGWHNTGDTNGAIYLIPHPQDTAPWEGSVGLYISKTSLKYNNKNVLHSGNSAVSGGGSSGGSSITVNIGGTSKTLTIPTSLPANGGNADYAISSPAAANYGTTGTTTKIKVKINSTTSWMLSFVVTLYQGYKASKIMISGYNYGSNYWHEPEAVLLGDSNGATSITVYFGYDSASNLWVGFDGGSYTGVSISDVTNGYTQISSLKKLFTISNVSSLTTLQKTVTATNSVNYASSSDTASLLSNTSIASGTNPSAAASGQYVKWYSQISLSSGYAGNNYGFPVSNNANGILWMGTHSGPYGGLLGISSNSRIYYRFISSNSFPTTANGGSWKKIAWTDDIPTKTSQLTNDSGYLTQHQSLSNYVTLNGTQTITGVKTFSTQQKFTVAQGTSPFTVTSTTKVSNLNSDLLDGYDSGRFLRAKAWVTNPGLDADTLELNMMCFTYSNNAPHTGTLIYFAGATGGSYGLLLNASYSSSGYLSFRSRNGDSGTWKDWSTILTLHNYTSYVNTTNFAGLHKTGTVTQVKIGSTAYNPSSGIVSLPAYPTSLPANGGTATNAKYLLTLQKDNTNFYSDTYEAYLKWESADTAAFKFNDGTYKFRADVANTANSVAWANVTGKPTIPTVTNYYWANVKISSSSNEATTPTFSTITTTGVSYVATLRPSTTNQHYLGSSNNRWNGVFSKAGNFSGLITLSVATGTSPFKITSTTVNTNLNADMLDGKHASDFAKASHSHSYLPLSGGTMTGNIVAHIGDTQRGIKFGSGYLNSLSNQLLWQSDEAIRFGSATWNWDAWAGLKYKHSNKIIYLGLADGTIFNANTALSGGKLYLPGISEVYTGNGTNKILHAGNSSVSGGGSSGGSSITVDIGGTSKTLTVPTSLPANGGNANTVSGYSIVVQSSRPATVSSKQIIFVYE